MAEFNGDSNGWRKTITVGQQGQEYGDLGSRWNCCWVVSVTRHGAHYMKTWCHPQNRKVHNIETPPQKDRTMSTGNMRKNWWSWNMKFPRYMWFTRVYLWTPTIRMDWHPIQNNWCPHLCHPQHLYTGCPSLHNPPSLSWLGTGTKYVGLHTWWLGSFTTITQPKCCGHFTVPQMAEGLLQLVFASHTQGCI